MGETDLTETINVKSEKVNKVNAGNINELEATLTSQTISLEAIFYELARRAANNMSANLLASYF